MFHKILTFSAIAVSFLVFSGCELSITLPDTDPVVTSSNSVTATEGEIFSYTATATAGGGTPTIEFFDLPGWLYESGSTVSGTAEGEDATFMIIASNGLLADTVIVYITVTKVYAYVRFLNDLETAGVGTSIKYAMSGLAGLGATWPETVTNGNLTTFEPVTPHTGDFTLTGKVQAVGGILVDGSWDLNKSFSAGDTVTITLTMDESRGYRGAK